MKSKVLRTLEFDKILHLLGEQAQSLPGKASCLSLVPKTVLPEVSALLIETREAYDLMMRKGRPSFEGVTDVTSILNRLRINASLNAHELIIIRDLLTVSRRIREYLKESSIHDSFPDNGVKNTLEGLQVIRKLEDEIRRCIISPDEIADDASPRLLSIRKSIARNQDAIRDKLNDFIRSEKYRKLLQEPIITMRNGRYVIPVKQENKGQVKGMIHDSSSSGATLYIEPMEVVNINNKVNELKGEEKEEIEAILRELSDFASQHTSDFKNNQELLVYGDVTFAKASFAIDGRCTFPELNDMGQIRIKQGIHPLLDPSTAVPIDFHIGDGFKTLVITGPNTGGKTVSLKTVGLFTLMAQSGLGIPAGEGSRISIFQGVFADIGDEQSIEQNLSTFSSHMSNIISILKDVNTGSLVLLDELGAGTDPTEGAALALAILEFLQSRHATTVATTHYNEIKVYASSHEGVQNASCEFDVKTLRPTFRLLIGVPGKSNALYISKRLGLSDEIVENAKRFIQHEQNDYEKIILSLEKDRQRMEKEKIKALEHTREIRLLKEETQKELNKMNHERTKVLDAARKEARELIGKATRQSKEILDEIQELRKDGHVLSNAREEAEFRKKINDAQSLVQKSDFESVRIQQEFPIIRKSDLKLGDCVKIVHLNQNANIISISDKSDELVVQAGIMKLNVKLSDLVLVEEKAKVPPAASHGVRKPNFSLELDIRGNTIDEASDKIERFLDDAYLSGIMEVQIIHGKGTGALRAGVHDILKTNMHVQSYRLGKYGEGETGVTMVTLN